MVYGGSDLGGWSGEELLHVGDIDVGDTNVADFASVEEFLHLGPGFDEIPVIVMFFEVFRGGGAGPVHEVEIDVVLGDSGLREFFGEVIGKRTTPSDLRELSIPSVTRLCQGLSSLVVIQISSRGTPEFLIPWPTSDSLPYARALEKESASSPLACRP